jgi:hypothetical protein
MHDRAGSRYHGTPSRRSGRQACGRLALRSLSGWHRCGSCPLMRHRHACDVSRETLVIHSGRGSRPAPLRNDPRGRLSNHGRAVPTHSADRSPLPRPARSASTPGTERPDQWSKPRRRRTTQARCPGPRGSPVVASGRARDGAGDTAGSGPRTALGRLGSGTGRGRRQGGPLSDVTAAKVTTDSRSNDVRDRIESRGPVGRLRPGEPRHGPPSRASGAHRISRDSSLTWSKPLAAAAPLSTAGWVGPWPRSSQTRGGGERWHPSGTPLKEAAPTRRRCLSPGASLIVAASIELVARGHRPVEAWMRGPATRFA